MQGDSTQRLVKDLDVMLGAESAVLILDDTQGVWPRHAPNLLLVISFTNPRPVAPQPLVEWYFSDVDCQYLERQFATNRRL